MSTLSQHSRSRQTCHTCPHDSDFFGFFDRFIHQFGFVTGLRIDKATGTFVFKNMVKTGLVTGDTGVNQMGLPCFGLVYPVWVCQKRTCHLYQICRFICQQFFGSIRHIDTIGDHDRDFDMTFDFGGKIGKPCSWHRCNDGWHTSFMPANACVNDVYASIF